MNEVLIMGASSLLSYLTWVLSSLEEYRVTVCLISEETSSLSAERWVLYDGEKCYQFRPDCVVANANDLGALRAAKEPFSLVLLDPSLLGVFENHPVFFRALTSPQTLFLVDSSEHPFVGAQCSRLLQPAKVFSMYSTADCRLLSTNPNSCFLMKDVGEILVGTTNEQIHGGVFSPFEDTPANNRRFMGLRYRYNNFHCGASHIQVLNLSQSSFLSKDIWRNVCRVLSIEAVPLIYDQPEFAKLGPTALQMLEMVFQEVFAIGTRFFLSSYGASPEAANMKWMESLLQEKEAYVHRNMVLQQWGFLPSLMALNRTFYDYKLGHDLMCLLTLKLLLRAGQKHNLPISYTESLYSYLRGAVYTRDTQTKKEPPCLLRLYMVQGITPHQNMMNFAPFRELPSATPPVESPVGAKSPSLIKKGTDTASESTARSLERVNGGGGKQVGPYNEEANSVQTAIGGELRDGPRKGYEYHKMAANNEESPEMGSTSHQSPISLPVDPELQALVQGTEHLTYGEETPAMTAQTPRAAFSGPEGPGSASPAIRSAGAAFLGEMPSYGSHQNLHSLRDAHGNLMVFHNGALLGMVPISNQGVAELAPVQKAYRHLPAKKYVSASKDRQTIESTFADAGFGRLMESIATSRYRGYDTSVSVLEGRRSRGPSSAKH